MSLLPPVVVGPLSECSSSVRVQGQIIGNTVDLFSNGAPVGTGVATWTDQVFPLKAGTTLAAGAKITATQGLGGVTSPPAPQPVVVQKKPPTIGRVGNKTHIYECGECLWLDGMVPGATVEVTVGASLRGKGTAAEGSARIALSPQTSPGDKLVAQQTACGSPGTKTNLAPPDPLPGGKRQLPGPTVDGPLQACQVAVNVSNAIDGAQVVLTETPAPGFSEQACFDLPSLWFQCPPLKQGSSVTAIQKMTKCEIQSGSSAAVVVGPPTSVPSPMVVPPLCAGSVTVRLTGLLPGSTVEIFQNATSLGTGSSPASTFDFAVPVLAGGSEITATQALCGHVSPHSSPVKVDAAPAAMPTPVVASPLFQCGAAVHVSNLHPGATVYVWSTFLGAPIGSQTVYTTQTDVNVAADVPVAPLLIDGDHIFATQEGCGHVSSQSVAVVVGPLAKPADPTIEEPVESCMHSVTVEGVVPGAHVEVYVNNVWRGAAIATAATVEVALSGSLNVADSVKARQSIGGLVTGFGSSVEVVSSAGFYYLTQHFTTARTGWFPYEKTLTVANVPKLKNLFTQTLDAKVYAQPLYAHHVNIPGLGAHNVVYVATENDTVYAFDADTKQPALWQRSFIPPGEQVVTNTDVGCPDISPIIGITSTPVIDCSSQTMWLVAETKLVAGGATTYHHRLYAVDIASGADRPGSPVDIQASFPGTADPNDGHGNVTYDPSSTPQMNRPALLLLGGRIYIGFGSHCDLSATTYHGWIVAYDATTLKQVGAFCTTPDSEPTGDDMGGVWQGGMGLAADPEGFVYFITGNGEFNANVKGGKNYGDTTVKLDPKVAAGNLFTVADYFTPANQDALRTADIDFGSGGPLILPDPPEGTDLPQAMLACGKDGQIYLLNRKNMGKYNGPGGPNHVIATVPLQPGKGGQPGVWGGPAYFNSGEQQFVYYAGNGGPLTAFVFSGNSLVLSKIGSNPNQSIQTFGNTGSTPVVSSNQQTAGTGIVWALTRGNPMHLLAFDATNLTGTPLFNSAAGPWPQGRAFTEPTVIQGKVYVPSAGQLNVFGL